MSIVGPIEALSVSPLVGESGSDVHFHPVRPEGGAPGGVVRPEGFEPPTFGLEVR